MALVIKDRVKETTTTTGTGAITLAGAPTNFQTFTSVLSNADTTFYAIIDDTNGEFEVGIGTFASSGTTLTRTTVLESSNSGSAVNLGSGVKQVFMTYPAEKSVFLDASNQLVINGSAVTSSVSELNIIDGGTSATSTTVADADRVVLNDNGTMVQVAVTDLAAYFDDEITAMPNLVTTAATTVGALNSGSITSGFGSIDNGSSAITTTGTITYGSLSDGSITITAFVDEDNMSSNSATLIPTQQSVKAYVDSQVTAQDLDATTDSGTIDIDLDSETLTIAGGEGIDTSASGTTITITGQEASTSNKGVASFSSTFFSVSSGVVSLNAAQTGITSLLATDIKIGEDDQTKIDFETANTINFYAGNEKQLILTDGALTPGSNAIVDLGTDDLEFKDAYFDGTVEADAITIGGTALSSVISGTTVDLATSITVSANNSANETVYPLFVDGATGTQGAETDTGLTYNPSSGMLTSTGFTGALTGNASTSTLASTTTVTDSTANTNFPVVFHDESNALLDDTGAFHYNPSTGLITATGLTLSGDLIVQGDTVTINTATLSVEDPLIILAKANNSSDSVDIGFYGLYDTSGSQDLYSGLFRDASDSGKWKLFKDNQAAPTTTVNTSGTGYAVGTLVANLEGNVTGTLQTAAQTNITSVGALDGGSITSGFGTIDTGSSAITTTGLISGGSLDIDHVLINGTTIGHTDDTDLITVADGAVTIAGDLTLSDGSDPKLKLIDTTNSSSPAYMEMWSGDSYSQLEYNNFLSIIRRGTSDFSNIVAFQNDSINMWAQTAFSSHVNLYENSQLRWLSNTDLANPGDIRASITSSSSGELDLVSDSIILGKNGNTDVVLTFNAHSADGVITWMEDEDYFQFSDDVLLSTTEKLHFRDIAIYINSSADGQLDLVADTEIQVAATTVDINGNVDISGTTTQTGVSTSAAKDVFNAGMSVKNGSSGPGFIEFYEDSDHGTNYVIVQANATDQSYSGNKTLTLPSVTGTIATTDDATALAIALG